MAGLPIEFLLLFFLGPALFAFMPHRIPVIPALWVLLAYCIFVMLRDPQCNRSALAIVLTFLGGLLFAIRYWQTGRCSCRRSNMRFTAARSSPSY